MYVSCSQKRCTPEIQTEWVKGLGREWNLGRKESSPGWSPGNLHFSECDPVGYSNKLDMLR